MTIQRIFDRRVCALFFCTILNGQPLPPCTIHTVIGDPVVFSGDGGPAVDARLLNPSGVTRLADGSLYLSDSLNHRIRKVDPQGIITTIAGAGAPGYSGDGGRALDAGLSWPEKIEAGLDGSLYFFDNAPYRVIRRIRPDGIIETVAGNNKPGETAEEVPATEISLFFVRDFTVSPSGEIYLPDRKRILRIDENGIVRRVSGGLDGISAFDNPPLAQSAFLATSYAHFAADGTLYIADSGARGVFTVGADGFVKTLSGTGQQGYSGDGPAHGASLASPWKIVTTSTGAVYFQDSSVIRKIENGLIETLPVATPQPFDWAAGPEGSLYIATSDRPILRLNPDLTQIAAAGREEFPNTGVPLTQTFIARPVRIAFDNDGTFYVADGASRAVYRAGSTLEVVTDFSDWPSEEAPVNYSLRDIAIDGGGEVYVSIDASGTAHDLVLAVEAGGLRMVAGGGGEGVPQVPAAESSVDATSVALSNPQRIAVGADGELFIYSGNQILNVDSRGRIGTLPIGRRRNSPLGGLRYEASATDMAAAEDGALYVADDLGNLHRYSEGVVDSVGIGVISALAVGAGQSLFMTGRQGISHMRWGGVPRLLVPYSGKGFVYGEGASPRLLNSPMPAPMAVAPAGDLYVAVPFLRRVRKIVEPLECAGSSEPVVSVAVNGASYSQGSVAPGLIVTLFGENLGPAQLEIGAPGPDGWATDAGGLQVLFDGVPAPVIFSRADQAAAIVPYEVKDAVVAILAIVNGVQAARHFVDLRSSAPGVFTLDASGRGQAAALNQDFSVNGASNPAPRGSIIAFYMTGGGTTDPPNRTGAITGLPLPILTEKVTVRVGGPEADVLYSGGAPGLVAGVEQVNVRIAEQASTGAAVALSVRVGQTFAGEVRVAVK